MPFKGTGLVRVGRRWRKPDAEAPLPPDSPVELVVATPVLSAPEDDLCWMIYGCTEGRRLAFLSAIGDRFGNDPVGTARFVLDRWSEGFHGLRWTIDAGPHILPSQASHRAINLLEGCFARTRDGMNKLAVQECDGDLERAIQRAVDEEMGLFGLDHMMGV